MVPSFRPATNGRKSSPSAERSLSAGVCVHASTQNGSQASLFVLVMTLLKDGQTAELGEQLNRNPESAGCGPQKLNRAYPA
jgi:hypothetical protein